MTINILTIGSKSGPEISSLINKYEKRLPRTININWKFIGHGTGDNQLSKQQESEKLLKYISAKDYVILLEESGHQYDNQALSVELFEKLAGKNVVIIIGGAYGVTDKILGRADTIWSLGSLVFPHELVRLMLIEQIYRSHTINIGHPYHHG